ncbi:MAG: hypothetical protein IPI30_10635 [Saprospiraceae bacterium]|nr:hypothetical protein [Candidatus Vicinibacter affinis]
MRKFQSYFFFLLVSFILIGCSKDSSNCLFVGGLWCDPASGTVCIEFRRTVSIIQPEAMLLIES